MEIVLEQEEIEELLKEALRARGTQVPPKSVARIRRNGKKGTMRIAFVGVWEKAGTVTSQGKGDQ